MSTNVRGLDYYVSVDDMSTIGFLKKFQMSANVRGLYCRV